MVSTEFEENVSLEDKLRDHIEASVKSIAVGRAVVKFLFDKTDIFQLKSEADAFEHVSQLYSASELDVIKTKLGTLIVGGNVSIANPYSIKETSEIIGAGVVLIGKPVTLGKQKHQESFGLVVADDGKVQDVHTARWNEVDRNGHVLFENIRELSGTQIEAIQNISYTMDAYQVAWNKPLENND